jgi:hypothetical protein
MEKAQNKPGAYRFIYLLAAMVALIVVDGLVTQYLIRSKLGSEGNPFLESLVGEPIFIPLKFLGAVLCGLILWDIYKKWPRVALVATSCFVAIYTCIVFWNIACFFISRGSV